MACIGYYYYYEAPQPHIKKLLKWDGDGAACGLRLSLSQLSPENPGQCAASSEQRVRVRY